MRRGKRKSLILIVIVLLASIVAGSFAYSYIRKSSDHTVTVFLVRHGQTVANTQGLLVGGGGDSPLTEEGKAGAQATGEALQNVHFSRAYSSPLGRTVTTRNLILSENRYSNQTKSLEDKNLKDISWGRAEGMSAENSTASFSQVQICV
jgi:broad specificity phosphatase PhoE